MRPFTPRPIWAAIEVATGVAIMAIGLAGYIAFSSVPWMLLAGALFVWWRGPGWRELGLRRPDRVRFVDGRSPDDRAEPTDSSSR